MVSARITTLASLLVFTTALGTRALALDVPTKPTRDVADPGQVLSPAEIDARATGRAPVEAETESGPAANPPHLPPGQPAFDTEPGEGEFDLGDYLVIGIFGAAILGFLLWITSGSSSVSSGLDGGASSWGTATGLTISSGGSRFDSNSSSSESLSSRDSGASSDGSFGGGGTSGSW